MKGIRTTCQRPDSGATSLVCGHPLPCPRHTALLGASGAGRVAEEKILGKYRKAVRRTSTTYACRACGKAVVSVAADSLLGRKLVLLDLVVLADHWATHAKSEGRG